MGICWYCHWGWNKPVADIFKEAVEKLDSDMPLRYGPAHIVWEDENWETHHINWCLEHFDEYKGENSKEELRVVKWSLEELLKVPEEERCIEPEDYDGNHPQNFPPPKEIEMVKV